MASDACDSSFDSSEHRPEKKQKLEEHLSDVRDTKQKEEEEKVKNSKPFVWTFPKSFVEERRPENESDEDDWDLYTPQSPTDDFVLKHTGLALDKYNEDNGVNFEFVKVLSAYTYVVDGIEFFTIFVAKSKVGEQFVEKKFEANVFINLMLQGQVCSCEIASEQP